MRKICRLERVRCWTMPTFRLIKAMTAGRITTVFHSSQRHNEIQRNTRHNCSRNTSSLSTIKYIWKPYHIDFSHGIISWQSYCKWSKGLCHETLWTIFREEWSNSSHSLHNIVYICIFPNIQYCHHSSRSDYFHFVSSKMRSYFDLVWHVMQSILKSILKNTKISVSH